MVCRWSQLRLPRRAYLRHGENILIADAPDVIAAEIMRLYADDGLWQSIASSGYQAFQDNFSLESGKTPYSPFWMDWSLRGATPLRAPTMTSSRSARSWRALKVPHFRSETSPAPSAMHCWHRGVGA